MKLLKNQRIEKEDVEVQVPICVSFHLAKCIAALGRRVNTLCQGEDGLRQQLMVYHTYYKFLPAPCELAPAVVGS